MPDVQDAQEYLRRFGYLPGPAIEAFGFGAHKAFVSAQPSPGILDNRTRDALQAFQGFVGLPVTGVLDEATVAFMERKRCGFPDVGMFVLQGNRWGVPELHYTLREMYGPLTGDQIRSAISAACGLWSAVCNLTFREDPNPDIEVRFITAEHGDGFSFDGAGNVLAHAFFPPPNGGVLAGDAHFDASEQWSAPGQPGTDLVTVAAHEIGHALGLAHSSSQAALMYPYYSGPHRFLDGDDVAGIQQLYGVRTAPAPTPPVPPVPPVTPPVTPPVQPPTPPVTPPVAGSYFNIKNSRVFHDKHNVRGQVEWRFTEYRTAIARGLRPCRICRPNP